MSSQSNNVQEGTNAGATGLAQTHAQLAELLELGEISREAFAEYSATADAALSPTPHDGGRTRDTAPTQFVEIDGV
jgi:hypothetical protein